jgi:hypothetical protein
MMHFCKISADEVWLNEQLYFSSSGKDVDWKKEIYRALGLTYPKFFKMDDLSKMTVLCFEILKTKLNLEGYEDDAISVLLGNQNSSLYTDQLFADSYQVKQQASPSLFVYTLPNITTGELAIKNKFYGENLFLIASSFEQMPFKNWVNKELNNYSKACLCGWVEKTKTQEECFLFFTDQLLTQVDINVLNKKYKDHGCI